MLKVQELSIVYGNRVIVQDISFQLNQNNWKMLVGPNGSGKSSVEIGRASCRERV